MNNVRHGKISREKNNRCNDGASDSLGRFWIGTMQTNISPDATDIALTENSGKLYCVNRDLSFTKQESNIGVSNTIAWSPDNKKFYFTDTLTGMICSYDFNLEDGINKILLVMKEVTQMDLL